MKFYTDGVATINCLKTIILNLTLEKEQEIVFFSIFYLKYTVFFSSDY